MRWRLAGPEKPSWLLRAAFTLLLLCFEACAEGPSGVSLLEGAPGALPSAIDSVHKLKEFALVELSLEESKDAVSLNFFFGYPVGGVLICGWRDLS